jgi:hypothetical protein
LDCRLAKSVVIAGTITFKCKARHRKLRQGVIVYSQENVKVEMKVTESESE